MTEKVEKIGAKTQHYLKMQQNGIGDKLSKTYHLVKKSAVNR